MQTFRAFDQLMGLPIVGEAGTPIQHEVETVGFASRKWDYEKMIGVLRHHRDRGDDQRAMTIVASDFLALYSYLAETYTVDEADRIIGEALAVAGTKYRNGLELAETKI